MNSSLRGLVFSLMIPLLIGNVFASTFAPTAGEVSTSGDAPSEGRASQFAADNQLVAQTDSTGQTYYQVGDRRYRRDVVDATSAFTGNPWPNRTVYYQFDPAVSSVNRAAWRDAAAAWSAVASLTFIESRGSGNYILVKTSSGNDSFVGMTGGAQEMNIVNWNERYIIAHEIGHALGLEHEQSRSDRDSYVVINYGNIQTGEGTNFDRAEYSVNYGPYDFESVMHYDRLAFSRNGSNTIEPRPAYSNYLYVMGQHDRLSTLDAAGMAQRYGHAPNDFFADRVSLSGARGSTSGTNAGATREPGEPYHFASTGGASVWYTWTAPFTGNASIDTVGSNYDTLLAVYRGASVSSLTQLGSSDDSAGPGGPSTVAFFAQAGETFQIAVDGFDGETGNIVLQWIGTIGPQVKADFTSDGNSDLVWQNNQTGARAIWTMSGSSHTGERFLPTVAPEWQIATSGDFNGDGQTDLVWQNTRSGARAIWLMNGSAHMGERFLPTVPVEWQIVSGADFNRDGQTDLLWQNNSTGARAIWLMNGTSYAGERFLPTIPTEWQIVGAGDFSQDGQADILWQNGRTGERAIWLMNDTLHAGERFLPTVAPEWQIAGTGEFNNDGRLDIVWQNGSTGQRAIWLMNGTVHAGERFLPGIPVQWEIRNH